MTASQAVEQACTKPAIRAEARHVVYIIDTLDSLQGGAERSLLHTIKLLPDRYRASVVTFKPPEDPSCPLQFPCPVHVFPLERTYGLDAVRVGLKLRRLIRDERAAIVQTFFESSDLWAGPIAKMSGCPVLISSRRDMGFRRRPMHQVAYRIFRPLFDQVHTVADAVRDYTIRQDRSDPQTVLTIPNGIDVHGSRLTYDRQMILSHYGLETASHVITDVTTIRRVKGIDLLMRTAAIVCRVYPAAVFVVVGGIAEESYFREVNALLSHLGLQSNFRFIGGTDDVLTPLHMSDVFCHLSRSDGLSNAVLEAMACSLPCVVSRSGGNPEAVEEGESGFVVPIEHAELTADRIITLLRDPDLRKRMGEAGRQRVMENFSAKVMVERFVALYDLPLEG